MDAAAQQLKHLPSMILVAWFAEYFAAALRHSIAGDNNARAGKIATMLQLSSDIERFAGSQLDHQPRRAAGRANAAFGGFVRRDNVKSVSSRGQQFPTPRRAAGEDQTRFSHNLSRKVCTGLSVPSATKEANGAPIWLTCVNVIRDASEIRDG